MCSIYCSTKIPFAKTLYFGLPPRILVRYYCMEKPPMKPAKHTPAEERHMRLIKGVLGGDITARDVREAIKEEASAEFSPTPAHDSPRSAEHQNPVPHRGSAEKVKSHAELSQPPADKE